MTASGHSYTVEIRFFGDQLEPSEISRRMQLVPSNWQSLSEPDESHARKKRPFWAYSGYGEDGFQQEWESLESGLIFLVRCLSPHRSTVIDLSRNYKGIWWCGHFQSGFDGGPLLSPALLAAVAEFGLPLFIDNYFSETP